ncbi:hypothetical protein BJ123_107102 [Rhodopseudomonas thermotolerans]|jgi:hypothetical protein|uniref:DUF2076 domain-containing protein n=2 Tax=Rhodopseudomonas TaxID=1073 RepID=A0A336JLD5_9BRAD|nr:MULTISPECIES: DUF2076 domain-containing protein [Rhodopseudomonas]RED37528.1 hypothetical protein BJ125_107103 [Rhodopseudomonas pentothenatexigens]REG04014.1 hypothetical protein BJ123_107102 [Rhodopseudomonas thermotolerans]SSW90495.1 hypothetical protein SAMN05892882_107103 [Rhodopseudomonas pentothenatexigens]
MTPQERQLVDDLFERLARLEATPRDPEAAAAISQGLRIAPNAIYGLVQTVLVQDEALKRAHERIQELEADDMQPAQERGGFLDSMRDAIFGQGQPQRGSVPNVPPPGTGSRPAWNTGQVIGQQSAAPPYSQPAQPSYGQPQGQYGGPFGGQGASPFGGGGGGGSFLGTAAAAAAGVVGGSLLLSSIRGMMGGGSQQSVADQNGLGGGTQSPWGGGDSSGGNLAQQAGLGDIGSQRGGGDDNSRYGMMDQNDHDQVADAGYDRDDMDMDSDDFDGDSDFA